MNDEYVAQVAGQIVEQLRQGTAPWQKPWQPGELRLPYNPATGKAYRGMNTLWLHLQGYGDPRWMTYKQAEATGAQVRKGAHGTRITYWKFYDERPLTDAEGKPVLDDAGQARTVRAPLERPRSFSAVVFNAQQIDGLPALVAAPMEAEPERHARAQSLLENSGARLNHVPGNRAYYQSGTDSITLPMRAQFDSADGYYATAFHELGHWTGHESRLARDLSHPFGSAGYAREELRAEIASLMLGERLAIGFDPGQHAAYVGSWIKALEEDPREIFRAAADAEKIASYVLAFEQEQVQAQQAADRRLPHEMTLAEFMAQASVEELTNHGRKWNVTLGERYAAFSDAQSLRGALADVHRAAVSNALYLNTLEARGIDVKPSVPPAAVLADYPDLVVRYPQATEQEVSMPSPSHPLPELPSLSAAQARDLATAVDAHRRTVGSYDWPRGMSVRLRTGKALEALGLVENQRSDANAYDHWIPTERGIAAAGRLADHSKAQENTRQQPEIAMHTPADAPVSETPETWTLQHLERGDLPRALGAASVEQIDQVMAVLERMRPLNNQNELWTRHELPEEVDALEAKLEEAHAYLVEQRRPDALAAAALLALRTSDEAASEAQRLAFDAAAQDALDLTLPHEWTGEVRIIGVRQQGEQFVPAELPAELPQAYELHVGMREGGSGEASLAYLTRLPTAAGAQALADRLAVIDANADPQGKAAKLARLHALSALQADLGAAQAMLRSWPDSSIARAAANEAARADALLTCGRSADALHYLNHLARLEATQQPASTPFLEAARSLEAILGGVAAAPAAVAPPAPERAAPASRIYLDVPFDEKDQAKALGAKWDKARKQWYAPQDVDVQHSGLARWLPTEQASPQEAFASAIRALGLELDGAPVMDGRIQRVPVTGDKGKQRSGAYAGHLDGRIPGGYIQNFKTGERVNWKYEGRLPSLTVAERAQCEAEAAERTARRAAETAAQHEATATLAQRVWDEAPPATADHPYCGDKGITQPGENGLRVVPASVSEQAQAAGIRIAATPKEAKALREAEPDVTVLLAGDLLVPARDGDGKLWSLQSINPRFKGLMKHGRKAGLYSIAGAEPGAFAAMLEANATLPLVLAEGYATADTVARLIGQPVIVAFDSGNLNEVAANLRARWPDRLMLVATDNDHLAEKTTLPNGQPGVNVGLRKAQEVAENYGAGLMVPVFREGEKGSDWNDYAKLHGMEAARSAIAEQMALARIDAALMSERLMTLARTRELEASDDPSTSADNDHVAHERGIAQEVMGQAISGVAEVRAEAIDALVANPGGARPAAAVQATVGNTNAVLKDEVREQREQVLGGSQPAQQRRSRGHDLGL